METDNSECDNKAVVEKIMRLVDLCVFIWKDAPDVGENVRFQKSNAVYFHLCKTLYVN